ncbi:MAG: aminotransferase class V-fold PLP-dependent enzyme [Terracidiphilus sp.]|nr:aminotransferase class V-fold PLP-dependent enzyme [Terracidiphilus sp.]
MRVTRRAVTKALGTVAFESLAKSAVAEVSAVVSSESIALPERAQFAADTYQVSLNNARWHPLSKGAQAAVAEYLEYKRRGIWHPDDQVGAMQQQVRESFAALIHASAQEIAFVPSTTAGENLIVAALGFPGAKGNIVTDALHFEGSLYLYDALARQGVDVRVVRPREWGIRLEDVAAAVDGQTRLVAVSHVSFINGFEHDLKAVAELAHAHGALVYADAVQAAGCVPIDVRASGIDAMGAASYKWLMGDMGLGFLYVRQEALGRLRRPVYGYRQLEQFAYHAHPGDALGRYPVDWKQKEDAEGYFEIGTYANAVLAALSFSLPWLQQVGVEKIHAHAQTLVARIRKELPARGYECITPAESRAAIVTFRVADEAKTAAALKRANVDVGLGEGRMRVSPSVYNTMDDVERLIAALE